MTPLYICPDAGGTATRWAAMDANGVLIAEGHCEGISGVYVANPDKRQGLLATLETLSDAERGQLATGAWADLVELNRDLQVQDFYVEGERIDHPHAG